MNHSEAFFVAIGRCISWWQAVENALYCSAHCVLGCEQSKSAIVFFAIRSPDAKIKLTRDLWMTQLGPKSFKHEAKGLFTSLDALCEERNCIAHFQVQAHPMKHSKLLSAHVNRMYFNVFDPSFAAQKKFQYQTDDLLALGDEFRSATDKINDLTRSHFGNDAWPKTPFELVRRPLQKRSDREKNKVGPQ